VRSRRIDECCRGASAGAGPSPAYDGSWAPNLGSTKRGLTSANYHPLSCPAGRVGLHLIETSRGEQVSYEQAGGNEALVDFRQGHLRYFVTVAEEGQITRAAKRLDVAQPALSSLISALEAELGFALFERHARGVTLTPAGTVFLDKARTVMASERDAMLTAASLARGARDTLEVGFLGKPPMDLAPQLFDAFMAAHPEAELSFRELPFPSESTAKWLAGVDVALCYSPTAHPQVELLPLWKESRVVLLRAGHPLLERGDLAVADVLDETFCGAHPSVEPVWAGFWTFDDHRGRPPSRLTDDRPINSLELVVAIASGRGIRGFSASSAAAIAGALSAVVAVPIPDAEPAICSLAWLHEKRTPLVGGLVDTAQAMYG